jgi:hypothetical protein
MKTHVLTPLFLISLTGCATMYQSTTQNITLTTVNDKDFSKTRCTLTNEEGSWSAVPNTSVNIHRDGNNLDIQCSNEGQQGNNSLSPSFHGGYLALDLLLDLCIVSCVVDGINNSFYGYSQSVSVIMQDTVKK